MIGLLIADRQWDRWTTQSFDVATAPSSRSARQPSGACQADRRLIPASSAVPAATAKQQKYYNDDEKSCEIHARSPRSTITISLAPDGRCSWWDSYLQRQCPVLVPFDGITVPPGPGRVRALGRPRPKAMIIGLVGLSRSMAVQYLWSSRHGRPAEGRVRLIYLICLAFRDYVRMLRSWYHRGRVRMQYRQKGSVPFGAPHRAPAGTAVPFYTRQQPEDHLVWFLVQLRIVGKLSI